MAALTDEDVVAAEEAFVKAKLAAKADPDDKRKATAHRKARGVLQEVRGQRRRDQEAAGTRKQHPTVGGDATRD